MAMFTSTFQLWVRDRRQYLISVDMSAKQKCLLSNSWTIPAARTFFEIDHWVLISWFLRTIRHRINPSNLASSFFSNFTLLSWLISGVRWKNANTFPGGVSKTSDFSHFNNSQELHTYDEKYHGQDLCLVDLFFFYV